MSETGDITRPLIEGLKKTGGMALRMNSGTVRLRGRSVKLLPKGTADILFFPRKSIMAPPGIPVWIETKAVKKDYHKEQQANQAAFQAEVEALGHRYIKVTSVAEGLEQALA